MSSNVVYTSDFKEQKLASESKAAYMSPADAHEDRKIFVENLGTLLSQTREGIIGCRLDDDEFVRIDFRTSDPLVLHTVRVNVHMDSYLAIIKDVIKHI